MINLKKILASATAVALLSSAFAGMAVQAATGDVLMTQNFDEGTDWGNTSRTDKASAEYVGVDTLAEAVTANMPDAVTGNVMHFATVEGQNVNVKLDMTPALSATAEVYGVSFDMYLRNAGRIGGVSQVDEETAAKFNYVVGIGSSAADGSGNATGNNLFEFSVTGGNISYVSNGATVDTGIDTGDDGVWVTADLKCDTVNKKVNGTLTAADGTVVTIEPTDFASATATTISQLYMQSTRYDGTAKGHIDNYLDNFVVTEAVADVYTDVVVNFIDTDGKTVKDSITDRGVVGNTYNVAELYKEAFEAEDTTKYYGYVSGGDAITVEETGNVVTLVFELTDKINYTVNAATEEGKVLETLKTGYVIPGENVRTYADYAMVVDGVAYMSEAQTVDYVPTADEPDYDVVFTEVENANAAEYDFEDDAVLFAGNDHMTTAVVDSAADAIVPEGTKAVKVTSTGSGESTYGAAALNIGKVAEGYNKVVVNHDSYISEEGRMRLNLMDQAVSSSGDSGLLSVGVTKSGGYRVNDTQAGGGNKWVHTSVTIDFAAKRLSYIITDAETGDVIISSGKEITQNTLQSIAFISWLDTSAYIDNIEVIATDAIVPVHAYNFENGETVFTDNDHAVTTTVDAADAVVNADINGEVALQFASDAETGESKQAVSTIKLDTLGAEKITVIYDSYVAEGNNAVFGVASGAVTKWNDTNVPFTSGFRTSKNYYVVNGESGSSYTAAAGQWVTTRIVFDAATGELTYAITTPDGITTYTSGTIATELTNIDRIVAVSWGSSSVAYIDNIKVYTTTPEAVDFDTDEDVALFVTNDHATVAANEDGNLEFVADSATGESVPATATYDISDITEGKSNVVIKYKSFVETGLRTVIGVDDIFSQGYGKESYYIINGATGSAYTGAADTWVDTTLNIDLNAGTCVWTVGFEVEGEYKTASKTTYITADSVDAITITATAADNSVMIDDIQVSAFGTYVETEPWMLYEVEYENGLPASIYIEEVEDPSAVEIPENTETTKYFLWKGMTPYVAAE